MAIESFLVRRLFVAPPSIDENQLFVNLHAQAAGQPNAADAFVKALSQPRAGWPSDEDFQTAVLRYPLFLGSHPDQRQLILQALEDSFPHRLPVHYESFTIEFVAPVLPRPEWLQELGVNEEQYWKLAGTLGNFTWGARGRWPSLRVVDRKRELQKMSRYGLELVRDFSDVERWSAGAIEERSRRLAGRAVTIWPGPRR